MNTSDSPSPQRRFNARLAYSCSGHLLLYAGFVLINAFAADQMETVVLQGLNLAIVYGFGLDRPHHPGSGLRHALST